jgi:hypothetical protein
VLGVLVGGMLGVVVALSRGEERKVVVVVVEVATVVVIVVVALFV